MTQDILGNAPGKTPKGKPVEREILLLWPQRKFSGNYSKRYKNKCTLKFVPNTGNHASSTVCTPPVWTVKLRILTASNFMPLTRAACTVFFSISVHSTVCINCCTVVHYLLLYDLDFCALLTCESPRNLCCTCLDFCALTCCTDCIKCCPSFSLGIVPSFAAIFLSSFLFFSYTLSLLINE
jgi:hypothetical protein